MFAVQCVAPRWSLWQTWYVCYLCRTYFRLPHKHSNARHMLCKWSTSSTNAILRSFPCHTSPFYAAHHGTHLNAFIRRSTLSRTSLNGKGMSFSTSPFTSGATALVSRPTPNVAANDSRPPEDIDSHTDQQVLMSLRPGQVSRATAQAVRLSMQKGKFGDALYLINSLLESHSSDPGRSPRTKLIQSESQASAWTPIDFGQPIPPSLCAHAFLHGLTRNGFGTRAAAYVETFEECGIRIRSATVTAIIRSLTTSPLPLGSYREQGAIYRLRQNGVDGEHVLKLRSDMVSDSCTQAAIKLLLHARLMGERRMADLYGRMINWLLLQGEIIAGALFVVLFIKSLEAQRARIDSSDTQAASDAPLCPDGGSPFVSVQQQRWFSMPWTALNCMNAVLDRINTAMETASLPETEQDTIGSALQALASLTILLDTGQLPTGKIAKLIRTLSSCPNTGQYVWILDRTFQKPVRVKAYPYFHNVLMRRIHSLTKPAPNSPSPRSMNVASYNALLYYALRHRLSPTLAADILEHMCLKGGPARRPTAATYNTLLRAGALARRQDITGDVLRVIRERSLHVALAFENKDKGKLRDGAKQPGVDLADREETWESLMAFLRTIPVRQKSAPRLKPSSSDVKSSSSRLTAPSFRVLTRLSQERWRVPANFYDGPADGMNVDVVINYILHATATRRPRAIANMLFCALPQLAIVQHPTWGYSDDWRPRPLSERQRTLYLRQAVHFGPQFFAVLLNALAKTKRTGAAERVWLLAKEAEEASWLPNFAPGVEPWRLPVAAYTSMMRCYAEEAKRAIKLARLERAAQNSLLPQKRSTSIPHSGGTISSGWAAFVTTMRKIREWERKYYWKRRWSGSVATLLHRCMVRAGLELYESLRVMSQRPMPRVSRKGSFPLPDERFYNEALNLFSRGLNGAPRPRRTTPRYWRARMRASWRRFTTRGEKAQSWTPVLQMVVQDLVEAGLPVPAALRVDAVGYMDYITSWSGHPRSVLALRPYAFPVARTRFCAHALPTVKTHGLPLPTSSPLPTPPPPYPRPSPSGRCLRRRRHRHHRHLRRLRRYRLASVAQPSEHD